MNRDLKAPNILTYKHNMGLDTGIENVFIGQVADMKKMLISVCWAMLSIKFFIFSFEDEGIVMLDLDEFGFFNGKNIFIPQAEIQNIKFRHGMLRRVLQFTVRNETSKFYLPNLVLGSPYQKENLNNLQSIIDKY
ncbi:hypothetical protein FD06_GL000724 [Apilactobacillus ozensis DSM 23829 = JCM 17196]|uniref:YokE-like PH domain-containing protein n=1 Tax=Apilactobacillus ozensis DSM 23829 = JCM 17196 TaxID=1423781 RepID=A0A0R2ALM8_9LACO|nr:hypothetical protein [Apilactobacillus ozensis]KRM67573.1 hypothetical protein FD06_GL000724 [Apilactobacillus ozensis DSM 23829 = JCM 17196]